MSRIQELFKNATGNETSDWIVAGGTDQSTSGREVQRTVKVTGTFGAADMSFEVDFKDDDPAPVVEADGTVIRITSVGVFEVLLSPESRLRAKISNSDVSTNLTAKVY